jgi:hypothetical protein
MRIDVPTLMTVVLVPVVMLALAACGRDDGTGVRTIDEGTGSAGSGSGAGSGSASAEAASEAVGTVDPATANTRVAVAMREWAIEPQTAQVPAGVIAFEVHNAGAIEHEFYVARADTLDALPRNPDGSVAEDQIPREDVLPEIEPFAAGATETIAYPMQAGTYQMFCNIADSTGVHVAEGMYTTFTVA